MKISDHMSSVDADQCKSVLEDLLTKYLEPAFGSLPKRETDLMVLEALEGVGYIERDPTIYKLIQRLRVTRSKARNLYYDRELRRMDTPELDHKVREALKHPLLQNKGTLLFALEVENPVVADHFRAIVQSLGFATDGSFSPSLVTLRIEAFTAVVEHFVAKEHGESLRKALVKAGAPDGSLRGVLKAVFLKLGEKTADEAGAAMIEQAGDYLEPIVDGATRGLTKKITELFKK